jgi:asparagine synthase (glutamine-hydrolysing)
MCGIAGVWAEDTLAAPSALAADVDAALAHRGPDGHAWYVHDEGRLMLLHRRLAIIDPTPAGSQPMTTPDGRYTIVFNGEIYNHAELRLELERDGEAFATRSDTEVLLRLVTRCGPQALRRARGMFAFAVWDQTRRTLLLARDRFGIKPCYVAHVRGRMGFASEIRALRAAGFGDGVDPAGVLAFLRWGSIPTPLTWVKNIEALEPGTWQQWADGRRTCGRFADPRDLWGDTETTLDADELQRRTSQALRDTVQAHLVADVPVGLFLSGGIDSAVLVATAGATTPRLHTFTVTFDERTHSEEAHAAALAKQFGTTHHTLRVDSSSVLGQAETILRHLDQPTIDGVNTYFVAGAVRSTGIKAVLSGVGGDEAFGGYPSFRRIARGVRLGRLPRALRVAAGRIASHQEPAWRKAKLRHAAHEAHSTFELYRAVRGWMMPPEIDACAGPALRDASLNDRVNAVEASLAAGREAESPYSAVARLESTMYLRHQLLRDVDVMSMAHGLEVRVPFVDHQLVGTVWPHVGGHPGLLARKRLLVTAAEATLPESTVLRPKQGFTLPFEHWIDGPLSRFVRDGLHEAARGGWIAAAAPEAVLRDWQAGACHWSRPWGLAVLGHFLRDGRV